MSVDQAIPMVLVMLALAASMVAVRTCASRYDLHPELQRKLVHVAMGLVMLSLPLWFNSVLPVALLAAGAVSALLLLSRLSRLDGRLSAVLYGVDRRSGGELYFPIAVAVLFALTPDDRLLYVIPLLMLTVSDAAAALIGIRYGQIHFVGVDGRKSIEGSLAFFGSAFLITHVLILLAGDTGRAESLLIAALAAALVTLVEVIAWNGRDNLFIVLLGYAFLKVQLTLGVEALTVRMVVLLALVGIVFGVRRFTTLNHSGILAATLTGYVTWAIGGWTWVIAPMAMLLMYTAPWPRTADNHGPVHNVHSVIAVAAAPLACLLVYSETGHPLLLHAHNAAYALQLAIIGCIQWAYAVPDEVIPRRVAKAVMTVMLVFVTPVTLLAQPDYTGLLIIAGAIPLVAGLALAFECWRLPGWQPETRRRWFVQGAAGFAIAAALVVVGSNVPALGRGWVDNEPPPGTDVIPGEERGR